MGKDLIFLKTWDWYDFDMSIATNESLYKDSHLPDRGYSAKKHMRLVIFPKDIEMIYGHSPRTARRMIQKIREANGLTKGHPVTFQMFCDYTKLDMLTVANFIIES